MPQRTELAGDFWPWYRSHGQKRFGAGGPAGEISRFSFQTAREGAANQRFEAGGSQDRMIALPDRYSSTAAGNRRRHMRAKCLAFSKETILRLRHGSGPILAQRQRAWAEIRPCCGSVAAAVDGFGPRIRWRGGGVRHLCGGRLSCSSIGTCGAAWVRQIHDTWTTGSSGSPRTQTPRDEWVVCENWDVQNYAVIIHEDPADRFWGEVPALPGCYSQGETVDELALNIREAIAGVLAVLREDGREPDANIQILDLAV